jgi:hypothetical protein
LCLMIDLSYPIFCYEGQPQKRYDWPNITVRNKLPIICWQLSTIHSSAVLHKSKPFLGKLFQWIDLANLYEQ